MRQRGGSFGIVLLALVMGIVLLLVARNWQAAAPRLSETMGARPGAAATTDTEGVAPRALPNASDMKRATDAHSQEVQQALSEAE